jgi:hypothetical protein
MMMNETYLLYAMIATNALFLLIVLFALLRVAGRVKRLQTALERPDDGAAEERAGKRHAALAECLESLEARVTELQGEFKAVATRTAKPRPPALRQLPIENAVRMARQGASVDDLTRTCGLNIGEARLMRRLHGQAPVTAARN